MQGAGGPGLLPAAEADSGTAPVTGSAARRCSQGHEYGGALGNNDEQGDTIRPAKAPLTWAERLRRVFDIEITVCPHCGGRMRVIADVTDPEVIDRILEHVGREGLPRAPPPRPDLA